MPQISERLLSSAFYLGEMPSGALLLKDNALYPWFLIVPHGEYVEWIDLPMEVQEKLLADLNALSRFLREDPVLQVEKINMAAIGNIVPQFHLHILGRHAQDPAWPGPVWGHSGHRDYAEGEVDALRLRLEESVNEFQNGV